MTLLSTRPRRRSTTLVAAAAVTVVLSLGACGTDTDVPATEELTPSTSAVTLPVSAVTTTLVDAGAEPRTVVTATPSEAEQTATLVAESTISQQIDAAEAQDFSTPPLTLPMTATSRSAAGSDGLQVDMTLGAATTSDATLQASLGPTAGSSAGFATTPSGAVTALTIDPSPDARDIARSAVEQALSQAVYRAVPFPAEPIGVGARWTVTQEVVSGISLLQTTTATLTSVDDGVATVDVAVTQSPEEPIWQLPDEQGTLNIESFVMTGQGQLRIDPSKPLPLGGTVAVGGDQVYRDANSQTTLKQTTSNTVTWS